MADVLEDKFGRKVKVFARVDGGKRKALKLQLVKPDPRGRLHVGLEFADKYVLLLILKPDMEQDTSLLRAVEAIGGKDDGDENADEE